MSLETYSKCLIQFIPAQRCPQRDYSDRSLIELRLNGVGEYSLRGVDVENNKTEIFKFQLIAPDLYKFGSSRNNCDEIRCQAGTYRLWLDLQTRDAFHKELRQILDGLAILNKNSSDMDSEISQPNKRSKIPTTISDEDNILINIQQLGESIQRGEVDQAAGIVSQLVSKHVLLKSKPLGEEVNDKQIRIRVKIDGIDFSSNDTNEPCGLTVYRSTTVNELRKLFEVASGFPSANQYFFVNGHLAYGESTMDDLKVEKNTLFVLFLTANYQKETLRL